MKAKGTAKAVTHYVPKGLLKPQASFIIFFYFSET